MKTDLWRGEGLSSMGICQGARIADINRSALSPIEEDFPVLEEPGRKEGSQDGNGQASAVDCHESGIGWCQVN